MCSRTFCWGLKEKYSFLENTRCSLYPACSELHREEPSSQNKLRLQNPWRLGSDSRKAVNRLVPDISAYCSISNSTVRPFRPWDVFFIVLENKRGTRQVYVAFLQKLVWNGSLSAFIVMFGEFCNAKLF